MKIIILVIAALAAVFGNVVPVIKGKTRKKEGAVLIVTLSIAVILGMMLILGVKLPSPLEGLDYFVGSFLKLKYKGR